MVGVNDDFKAKLKEVLAEGIKFSVLRESHKNHRNVEKYDVQPLGKFNSLLNYLVGIHDENISELQKELLKRLNFINRQTNEITKIGFKFLLSERPAQINLILMQYLEFYKENKYSEIHLLIKLIFNMHCTLYDKFYGLSGESKKNYECRNLLSDFEELGLIFRRNKEKPTKFKKSILLHMWQEQIPIKDTDQSEQFLVIESNFRYLAYTDSPYHRALLSIFSDINYEFPNCFIGEINNKSVSNALRKGITADQICFYMKKHGRYQMEPEGNESKISVVPENVLYQIKLWEEDLQWIKSKEGILISGFDTTDKYKKFLAAAKSADIYIYGSESSKVVVCSGSSAKIMEIYSKI